ncbi:MAG: flotillin domain-containing protein, partial [Pseudomonadota bacterium]
ENVLSSDLIDMKVQIVRLEAMPQILAEAVKPAEKIDSIRIHHLSGLNGTGAPTGAGDKTPVNQALDSIMGMAVQLPTLKKLGNELGLSLDGSLEGLLGDTPALPQDEAESQAQAPAE